MTRSRKRTISHIFLSSLLLALPALVVGRPNDAIVDTKAKSIRQPQQHEQSLRQLQDANIIEIASEAQDLGTLVSALQLARLVEELEADGPLTVFAPSDEAFEEAGINFLLEPQWILHLQAVLLYHVAEGSYFTDQLSVGDELNTLYDDEAMNVTSVNPVTVNDAEVVMPNIEASNGVVHVVDQVLFPAFTESSVVDIAAGVPDTFSTLVQLLDMANLTETLADDEGEFTVFAPTNDAFANLEQSTLQYLMSEEGAEALEEILLYHVVEGIAYANGVEVDDTAETLEGSNITVTSAGDTIMLNGASTVVSGDILARNGVIHVIDTVLAPATPIIPPTDGGEADNATDDMTDDMTTDNDGNVDLETWVFLDDTYSTFYTLLNMTDLPEQLMKPNPLTLMAPDNAAFDALPDSQKYLQPEWYAHLYDILLYHIVPGELYTDNMTLDMMVFTTLGENFNITSVDPEFKINNISNIVDADNTVSNGVAHGIDAVLLPPSAVFDLVDIVVASPFFEEFLGLLVASGMDQALREDGPFTIFAPTNNAINALSRDVVQSVTGQEGLGRLQEVLKYHIVPGIILSDDIEDGDMLRTLEGSMLTLTMEGDDKYFVNGADIFDMDILAGNGVIHVTNRVMIPLDQPATTEASPTEAMMEEATTEAMMEEATTTTEAMVVEQPAETDAPTASPTDEVVDVVVESPVDPNPVEVSAAEADQEGDEEEVPTASDGDGTAPAADATTEELDSDKDLEVAVNGNYTYTNTTVDEAEDYPEEPIPEIDPEGGGQVAVAATSSAPTTRRGVVSAIAVVSFLPSFLFLLV